MNAASQCWKTKNTWFGARPADGAGSVRLQRETVPAALKKANELLMGGYFNVEIVIPDGAAYKPTEFEKLNERVGIAPSETQEATN